MANNYKMDKGKLLNIGIEAFRILEEEEYRIKGRPYAPQKGKAAARPSVPRQPEPPKQVRRCQYQPQQPLVYQVMEPVSSTEEMINSYEAMKLHDGVVIMDYSKRKSAAAMAY